MGINGLWPELQAVEQKISLSELAVSTGFVANVNGVRGYRVGIDASGWMYRACALQYGNAKGPALVQLFARCSRLFRLPFIPIFVFDGPARPKIKRGAVIRGNDHCLAESFQQMLDGFGFVWHIAPGEAEATLATMNVAGTPASIDAILTDDSDAFVFGASTVLRIRTEDNKAFEASQYSANDISTRLGLDRDGLILIALLAGGDYSNGLRSCGITIAIGLTRAGLGTQLISALFSQFPAVSVDAWRQALRLEMQTNNSGHLPHRCKALADKIPHDFPDLNILNLYLRPIVSNATLIPLALHPPRLDILARFAEKHFAWGNSFGILEHFAEHLFAGLVVRELVQGALANDGFFVQEQSKSIIGRIVGDRRHTSTGQLAELRVLLNVDPAILQAALGAITGKRDTAASKAAAVVWVAQILPRQRAWVPQSMVEHLSASIVLDYISAKNEGKQPGKQESGSGKTSKTKKTKEKILKAKRRGGAGLGIRGGKD
ncbi:PIN domain-like protein [Roridomyces roridus]|uniref:PIN domain-like protein n=1 Tax=Roridomyces roridus TaxID=1738132 RepID=A0AAD7BG64_9AGAR|nr:PIN domain-like protein [Roridomyces roridus]